MPCHVLSNLHVAEYFIGAPLSMCPSIRRSTMHVESALKCFSAPVMAVDVEPYIFVVLDTRLSFKHAPDPLPLTYISRFINFVNVLQRV